MTDNNSRNIQESRIIFSHKITDIRLPITSWCPGDLSVGGAEMRWLVDVKLRETYDLLQKAIGTGLPHYCFIVCTTSSVSDSNT